MTRSVLALALAGAITTFAWLPHANAAPPTVTPSPGYDARFQEQRANGNTASQPASTSGASGPVSPVAGHHVKRTHHQAH
jgi:hypothetical protein